MLRMTDVVKNLMIINVLMFFGTMLILGDGRGILALFYIENGNFQPFQLISHMFMHGGPVHLFFNMFVLYMFGSTMEALWGPKRFLLFYFIAGFGAVVLDMVIKYVQIHQFGYINAGSIPMWGASGAIVGVLIAFAMKFPERELMLIIPPMPIKAKYLALLLVAVDLFGGFGGIKTGIAHFAHLGGALFGALTVLYWNKYGSRF